MRHAVLRSKQVDPYIFFDCEPVISVAGVLTMMKGDVLVYAFAPGTWQHIYCLDHGDAFQTIPAYQPVPTESNIRQGAGY